MSDKKQKEETSWCGVGTYYQPNGRGGELLRVAPSSQLAEHFMPGDTITHFKDERTGDTWIPISQAGEQHRTIYGHDAAVAITGPQYTNVWLRIQPIVGGEAYEIEVTRMPYDLTVNERGAVTGVKRVDTASRGCALSSLSAPTDINLAELGDFAKPAARLAADPSRLSWHDVS